MMINLLAIIVMALYVTTVLCGFVFLIELGHAILACLCVAAVILVLLAEIID